MTYEEVTALAERKISARKAWEVLAMQNTDGLSPAKQADLDLRYSIAQEEMWKSAREYERAVKLYNDATYFTNST